MSDAAVKEIVKLCDPTEVYSHEALCKGAGGDSGATGLYKAGWPVFASGDSYVIVPAASVKSQGTPVGVLLEDVADAATGATVKVAYAGRIYIAGVRAAGLAAASISDIALKNLEGHIVFVDEKEVAYAG